MGLYTLETGFMRWIGSVDFLALHDDETMGMFQPIDIVGQPEHEGLRALRQGRAARGTVRELALGRRDDGFHQRPLAIERTGK